jgi:hypothetical protein
MTNYRVTARRDYIVTFEAPNTTKYVELAEVISMEYFGQELDSPDAGDATGLFIRVYDTENADALEFEGFGCKVRISTDTHLFKWEHS